MKLYNTASRQLEDFTPQNPPKVSFYSCGPTVYDTPHIGNWFTFIRYDLFNRALKAAGYDVDWIMNITDVGHLTSDADDGQDKLEKGAQREGKTAWEVAQHYTDYFTNGLRRLNINTPTQMPKATDHIAEQIDLIQKLETNGHTYVIDDGVYFDTNTFKDYGKMAQLDLEHLQEGARVEVNQQKKNPTDFALWKFSPTGSTRDMEWDSPWGKGFPGWHLECSAMAMKYLGETLDIHAGGIDHIPVHHSNEIAQSEGATGKPFANYWVHMNFILVNGKKMAKSDGSFITLEDIEQKGFDLMAFRLMVLQSQYRTEAHFSWENLEAAQNLLKRLRAWAVLRYQDYKQQTDDDTVLTSIEESLQNDLNTPIALASLVSLVDQSSDLGLPADFNSVLAEIDGLFGLELLDQPDISADQKAVLAQRQQARDSKDWVKADELRDQLLSQGVEVRDTPDGQIWNYS